MLPNNQWITEEIKGEIEKYPFWEKRNVKKRESWSLTMLAWGVSLVLLWTGRLYLDWIHYVLLLLEADAREAP